MALKFMLVIMTVAAMAAIFTNVAEATEFMVGDDEGWAKGVNYTAWTEGKEFFVGDTIVFMYDQGAHNVYKVTGPEFRSCQVPKNGQALSSGNDAVKLVTPGKKWYICGFPGHCDGGQKVIINVQVRSDTLPSPGPTAPETGAGSSISPTSVVLFAVLAFLTRVFM
ncbi:uncharacterized protein A4U43_C07F27520 [Asparagus officinalis]|uniref:Phytocyanin domain-containing protein n=3 Tax=Asparagus officinalis TaxID=4686 RepID=A0A1R3L6G3_ASPOF|nr:uncharacterized protein A4U43_UnF6370 [Asparagus officinalis]ONK64575.1 uncharacterized protein A4U43_C07F27520 [Asparagus officinalis]